MYLIDGHNLIGRLHDISLSDPHDEALLVQKLTGFSARTGKKCVVIFDHGLPGGRSRWSTPAVEVVFASSRSNADALMIERIRRASDPAAWIVISSDQRVLAAAKERRMRTFTSAEFARQLAQKSPPALDKDDDLTLPPGKRAKSRLRLKEPQMSPEERAFFMKAFGIDDDA